MQSQDGEDEARRAKSIYRELSLFSLCLFFPLFPVLSLCRMLSAYSKQEQVGPASNQNVRVDKRWPAPTSLCLTRRSRLHGPSYPIKSRARPLGFRRLRFRLLCIRMAEWTVVTLFICPLNGNECGQKTGSKCPHPLSQDGFWQPLPALFDKKKEVTKYRGRK